MHPIASDQREVGAISESIDDPGRWEPDDELLVWTVSRVRDGRRYGVERDCHVVYAVSGDFFVEQTRRYRASAQQCIDLLLAGGHAGTTQRKIPLDGIMAVHSDPRSGRLMIKTLNGTHRLEPIGHDEADVLRQIATELVLRMPPGGAHFEPLDDAVPDRRLSSVSPDENDRLALASVENARREDEPDTLPPPQFDRRGPQPAAANPSFYTSAAPLDARPGPDRQDPTLPPDIKVVGGIPIRFAPGGADPVSASAQDPSAESESSDDGDRRAAGHPIGADDDAPTIAPSHEPGGRREAGPVEAGHDPAASAFVRRQQRSLLDRLDGRHQIVESHDNDALSPMTASSMLLAEQADGGGLDRSVRRKDADVVEDPPDSVEAPAGLAERRVHDDPGFPAVFNRRGVAPTGPSRSGLPGWIPRLGKQDAAGESVPEPTDTTGATDDENDQAPGLHEIGDDSPVEKPVPTPVADDEFGQTVGFNPDFDVNQFR